MTQDPPQQRRRTRPTIEPSDHLAPDDGASTYDEGPSPDDLSRQRRRQLQRRRSRPSGKKIVVEEVVHEPIFVDFVYQEYEITPPRMDALFDMADTDESDPAAQLKVWLWEAFGDSYDDVMDRIEDPEDKAGWEEVRKLIEMVTKHVGKNPRTS